MLSILATIACMVVETEVNRVSSPDGRYRAIVVDVDGGATTGIATKVVLQRTGWSIRGPEIVLAVDEDHGRAATGIHGGPYVDVGWLDAHTLVVTYDTAARIFKRLSRSGDVVVRYRPIIAGRTQSTDRSLAARIPMPIHSWADE